MVKRHELMKDSTASLLLCLIAQQPMYGYQIIKELGRKSEGYFEFKEGTLYPVLHRLEKAGLISGKWQVLPSGQQLPDIVVRLCLVHTEWASPLDGGTDHPIVLPE